MKNKLFTKTKTVQINDLPVRPSGVSQEESDKVSGGMGYSSFFFANCWQEAIAEEECEGVFDLP